MDGLARATLEAGVHMLLCSTMVLSGVAAVMLLADNNKTMMLKTICFLINLYKIMKDYFYLLADQLSAKSLCKP